LALLVARATAARRVASRRSLHTMANISGSSGSLQTKGAVEVPEHGGGEQVLG
jgi:hypothetical protein